MRLFRFDTNKSSAQFPAALREPGSWRPVLVAVGATVALLTTAVASAQLQETLQAQMQADKEAAQSQKRIDQVHEQTLDAAAQYAQAMAEAESYERYNEQLKVQLKSQEDEIASTQQQLLEIKSTGREVLPLMQKMVQALDQFVALDIPFLIEQRTARVNHLKELMSRADVSISEKYRLIMEAYQIELEYGRTLETYEGTLTAGDETRTVQFVRLGRVSLMYRTLDGDESGYWDATQKQWVDDSSYGDAIERAIRVAKKEIAPELLIAPVPAPVEVKS
jgi:chromosome segregation ATPase